MCPIISNITASDMIIHVSSENNNFILGYTAYQMKYLIPKTLTIYIYMYIYSTGVYVHHCHVVKKYQRNCSNTEYRCVDAHNLVSASASLPSKLQDLALRFTGLSRTKLIFPGFLGPGNFTNTILGLSRKHGNPDQNNVSSSSRFIIGIYSQL